MISLAFVTTAEKFDIRKKMTSSITQNKRRSRSEKSNKKKPMNKKIFFRITLVLLLVILIFIGVGFLKKGNIKKVNEQPKSFPVTVQN